MTASFSAATPEQFYAGHRRRQDAYHRLSTSAAAQGDSYVATLAMWASDLSALQAIMWERVFTLAPGPEPQYLAATNALSTAMSQHGLTHQQGESAEQVVRTLRGVLPNALETDVYQAVEARLSDTTHLQELPAADHEAPTRAVRDFVGEFAPATYIDERVGAARDLMTLAGSAQESHDMLTAASCAYQSTMLLVEAYVLQAAVTLGERSIASAILRWRLLCDQIQTMGSLPLDPDKAVAHVVEVVSLCLGPIETERLYGFAAERGIPLR